MKRITVTITDEQAERLARRSERCGLPVSAVVREILELEYGSRKSPFADLIGIASKELPYSAANIDEELAKTYADAIRADSGL